MSAHSDFEKKLGYAFADPALLTLALTHASLQQETENNERLEFLGDRILGLAIADMLYHAFPGEDEGALAKRLAALVCQETLTLIAERWSLSTFVQAVGHAGRDSVESDAVEAVIGAVYLDAGYAGAEKLIKKFWQPLLESHIAPPEDAKTRLQEWVQARGLDLPVYQILARTGSDHAPVFEIEVAAGGLTSKASGANKRAAEKDAAAQLLIQLEKQKS